MPNTSPRHPRRPASVIWRSYRITSLFLGLLLELLWNSLWARNQMPDAADAFWNAVYHRQAARFRKVAEEMGGLLIKVGQFLSSRVDLLPRPYIDELAHLQDHVAEAPWEAVQAVLTEEIGPLADHFLWFSDRPLASASLGQVYQAHLLDGTPVAVKVQRPGIREIVEADLRALTWVVAIITRLTRFGRTFDLFTVLREFRKMVFEELDYQRELNNTEVIRHELQDIPWVRVPYTVPRLSTRRVLVMEFCQGTKIDQVSALQAAGIAPGEVAERVIKLYLHLVFEAGVYHADPHAGNILVDAQGSLILLDYGMVGSLDAATRHNIRKLFIAVSQRNPQGIVDAIASLGMLRPEADMAKLKKTAAYLFDRYYAETLNQLTDLNVGELLRDFERLLRDEAIQVPGHFAFLGRAIAILVGLATLLDPNINLVTLFAPYAQRFILEDAGGPVGYARRQTETWVKNTVTLPSLAHHVLTRLDQGDLETQVTWIRGERELKQLARSVRGLTEALYVIGFTIAGTLLLNSHPWTARILFLFAAVSLLWSWRDRRRSH